MNLQKEYQRVQAMTSQAEIEKYCEAHRVELTREFSDLADAKAFICEQLGLEADEDDDPGTTIDKLVREHQRKHPGLSYERCLGVIRRQHPELARRYANQKDAGQGRS